MPARRLCVGREGPRGEPALSWEWPRGGASGLCELPTALDFNLWSPRGTQGIREHKDETLTDRVAGGSAGTKASEKSRSSASHGWCQMLLGLP